MKTREFFDTKPYVVSIDRKGYYYIDNNCTYGDLMGMVAEETTSPRGVEAKLQVGGSDDEYFLFRWLPGGKRRVIEYFSTKEEAELEWLNRTYEYDFLEHELSYMTFDNIDDAIEFISSSICVSIETAKSLIKWHKKLQSLYAEQSRKSMVSFLKKAIKDAQGKPTKKLRHAVNYFRFSVPMYGSEYNLMLKVPYTDDDLELYDKAKSIVLKPIL